MNNPNQGWPIIQDFSETTMYVHFGWNFVLDWRVKAIRLQNIIYVWNGENHTSIDVIVGLGFRVNLGKPCTCIAQIRIDVLANDFKISPEKLWCIQFWSMCKFSHRHTRPLGKWRQYYGKMQSWERIHEIIVNRYKISYLTYSFLDPIIKMALFLNSS